MRALIVGAGIAGDALALLLDRAGWAVEVAELASGIRSGGQTVDLRGPSVQVLDRLGLLGACRQRLVPQRGMAWVDADGRRLAAMPVEAFGGRGFVSSDELLRTDLAEVIHDAVGPGVRYRFGDTVDRLERRRDGEHVRFRSGADGVYDLVVGADGAHSRVRALRFGEEESFRRPLGLAHAWFTLVEQPSTPLLDGWFAVHNAPGRRAVAARPGRPGRQEIGFTFAADELPARRDRAARLALLETAFAGVGWRSRELLDAARTADDLALDAFDQVRVDRWHDGGVVLLGDSAWCASPLSGLGTALALTGAALLADALAGAHPGSLPAALDRFETAMRPRTVAAQRLPPGRVRSVAPRTAGGIRVVSGVMRLVQAPPIAGALTRLAAGSGHADALPVLPRAVSAAG